MLKVTIEMEGQETTVFEAETLIILGMTEDEKKLGLNARCMTKGEFGLARIVSILEGWESIRDHIIEIGNKQALELLAPVIEEVIEDIKEKVDLAEAGESKCRS